MLVIESDEYKHLVIHKLDKKMLTNAYFPLNYGPKQRTTAAETDSSAFLQRPIRLFLQFLF